MSRRDPSENRSETPTRARSGTRPLSLTAQQRLQLSPWFAELQAAEQWHGGLPLLILERCWLRLSAVPIQDLARRLPPDSSREAPELVLYRALLAAGHGPLQAEQLCWLEFGMEACRQAQRRLWDVQERGNHDWTLERYLDLLRQYRQRFAQEHPRPLPLLVLARPDEPAVSARHRLLWLAPGEGEGVRSMRHTCA
jgi:hypothetical protein